MFYRPMCRLAVARKISPRNHNRPKKNVVIAAMKSTAIGIDVSNRTTALMSET